MPDMLGYVDGEDEPRAVELIAGSKAHLGELKMTAAVAFTPQPGVDIGDVTVNNAAGAGAYVQPGTSTLWDVEDRIGRLLGRITNYDVLASGTLGALNEVVTIDTAGLGTIGVKVTGTWAGTIAIQGEILGGTWDFLPMVDALTGAAIVTTTINGVWQIGCAGFKNIRVLMYAYTSGTATVTVEGTSATAGVFLSKSIPTGTNVIGDVGYKGYTTTKSGQITVTTAETAVVGTTESGRLFALKAHPDNTDAVWVGNDGASDVTNANGFPLNPGETVVLNMANLNQIYVDADVNGEKLCWIKLA